MVTTSPGLSPVRSDTCLKGFIDRLEQGDGFVVVAGWVALAGNEKPDLPVLLTLGEDQLSIERFFFREDLAESGIAQGNCSFVVLYRTDSVFLEMPSVVVTDAQGATGTLDSVAGVIQPFQPAGSLAVTKSRSIGGRVFDPAVWLGRAGASLTMSGDVSIAVALNTADIGDRPSIAGHFPGVVGSHAPVLFEIPVSLITETSDSDTHHVELVSGVTLLDSAEFTTTYRGKGYIEQFRGTTMLGWAAGNDTSTAAEVDILWDGIRYITVKASEHREDLIKKQIVSIGGGFRYTFQNAPGPAGTGKVSAVLRESGIVLSNNVDAVLDLPPVSAVDTGFNISHTEARSLPICIIVPIYNAAEDLKRCLASLERCVTMEAHLILVDDCSPDPEIGFILAAWEGRPNVSVILNERNLGFSGSINVGIQAAGRSDVVLLNSDTIVTTRWLEKLRQAAYSARDVATVTALSCNAGAFSVPEIGSNVFPRWLDPEAVNRIVQACSGVLYPEAPTGNGFCMYVRRDCLDEVGLLDAEAFPRGYGEENDFCMRAMRMGFRNIVDDRTFIYHKRSASFGDGDVKATLYESGRAILSSRYPEYSRLTPIFSEDPAFLSVRWRVRKALAEAQAAITAPRSRVLYVISTQSGGTPQTNRDLMGELSDRYEPWLMRCDARTIELSVFRNGTIELVETRTLRRPIVMGVHQSEDYDRVVTQILTAYAFELVHIRHIAWHSLSLPRLCHDIRVPVLFSFHDFYAICPTVKLLDENNRFCGGRCTPTDGECTAELWPANQIPPLKHRFIHQWQARMNEALRFCNVFITTSPGAAMLLESILPVVAERGITVIPHGRSFKEMESVGTAPTVDEPLRILMPGNINPAKGSDLCEAVLDEPGRRQVEFHILGDAGPLTPRAGLVLHGRYKREEFGRRARAIRPHVGTVLSIWPETYCHTLTEMWAAGIPVVAVDLGAVGERIRTHGGGWLIPIDAGAEELNALLRRIRRDSADYEARRAEVARWQSTYGRFYTTRAMSDQYDMLYRRVVGERRLFNPNRARDAVVAVVSQFLPRHQSPASAHIRIGERTRNDPDQPLLFRHYNSAAVLSQGTEAAPAAVLVQRDTLDPDDVDEFVAGCSARNIRIVVDCDDDLLSVPSDKDVDGRYWDGRPAFQRLLAAADLITVSTPALLERFSVVSSKCRLVPNTLSTRLWLPDLGAARRVASDKIVALYAGTMTHDADLQLLREPVERIQLRYPQFELRVIGAQRTNEDWFTRIDVPDTAKDYPEFVRWFRLQCQQADFGVAPLVDSTFNACKSDLKFLDYAAAGLTGIYSDVPSYRGTVTHGDVGLLTGNDPAAWEAALSQMIAQPARRAAMARRAHALVVRDRMAINPGAELQAAILALLPRPITVRPENTGHLPRPLFVGSSAVITPAAHVAAWQGVRDGRLAATGSGVEQAFAVTTTLRTEALPGKGMRLPRWHN